jgi:hypothetical protein
VDLLQLKAFANLRERGWQNRAAASIPPEYGQYFLMDSSELWNMYENKVGDIKRLRQVQSDEMAGFARSQGDQPLCDYTQDGEGEHLDATAELNHCLQELFKHRLKGELHAAELTAKVYYNLSISPAPPNIDTFNALLLGFSRARQPEQVRDVISAIHLAHIRHNEVTLATILRFFTATDDSGNFWQWFARIRGWYGGLVTARPDVVINQAGSDRLIDHRNGSRMGRILQLPTPTPMVFGAIIRGVLKFDGFAAALELCETMGKEGWRLSMSGLAPLLKDCAARKDFPAGLAIWEQIQERRTARMRRTSLRNPRLIQIDTYTTMLRLCSRCGQQELFAQILDQASHEHEISYADLTILVKALNDPAVFNYADGVEFNKDTEPGVYDDDLADAAVNIPVEAEPPPLTPSSSSGHVRRKQASQWNMNNSLQQRQRRPQQRYHLQPITSAEYATLVTTPLPQPPRPPTRTTLFFKDTLPGENDPSAYDAPIVDAKADSPMQENPVIDADSFSQLNLLDESDSSSSPKIAEDIPPLPRFTLRPVYAEDLFVRPPSFQVSWRSVVTIDDDNNGNILDASRREPLLGC